jgi:tetratricopeptide (TPR) repeat protein
MYRAMVALAEGRLGAVDGLISSYASLAESSGDRNVEHCVAAQLGEASWLRGQTELAIGGAEALVDRFPGMPEWRCVLAYFFALAGRTQEAAARISEVEFGDKSRLHENMNTVLAMCALADAAVRAGLRTEAEKMLPRLRRYRNTHALAGFGVVSWGSVERFVGRIESLLGDWTHAEESLREALSRDTASGAATLIARSELALAEMLVCRGAPGARKEAMRLLDGALRRIEGRALTQLERDASRVGSACC